MLLFNAPKMFLRAARTVLSFVALGVVYRDFVLRMAHGFVFA